MKYELSVQAIIKFTSVFTFFLAFSKMMDVSTDESVYKLREANEQESPEEGEIQDSSDEEIGCVDEDVQHSDHMHRSKHIEKNARKVNFQSSYEHAYGTGKPNHAYCTTNNLKISGQVALKKGCIKRKKEIYKVKRNLHQHLRKKTRKRFKKSPDISIVSDGSDVEAQILKTKRRLPHEDLSAFVKKRKQRNCSPDIEIIEPHCGPISSSSSVEVLDTSSNYPVTSTELHTSSHSLSSADDDKPTSFLSAINQKHTGVQLSGTNDSAVPGNSNKDELTEELNLRVLALKSAIFAKYGRKRAKKSIPVTAIYDPVDMEMSLTDVETDECAIENKDMLDNVESGCDDHDTVGTHCDPFSDEPCSDEDEDLLRAQLLMSMASKKKEPTSEQPHSESTDALLPRETVIEPTKSETSSTEVTTCQSEQQLLSNTSASPASLIIEASHLSENELLENVTPRLTSHDMQCNENSTKKHVQQPMPTTPLRENSQRLIYSQKVKLLKKQLMRPSNFATHAFPSQIKKRILNPYKIVKSHSNALAYQKSLILKKNLMLRKKQNIFLPKPPLSLKRSKPPSADKVESVTPATIVNSSVAQSAIEETSSGRIVIKLGEDTDSEEENVQQTAVCNAQPILPQLAKSVDQFLKQLRQNVEQKQEARVENVKACSENASVPSISSSTPKPPSLTVTPSNAGRISLEADRGTVLKEKPLSEVLSKTPLAMKHLPSSQQVEYRRLKLEIARREELRKLKSRLGKPVKTLESKETMPDESNLKITVRTDFTGCETLRTVCEISSSCDSRKESETFMQPEMHEQSDSSYHRENENLKNLDSSCLRVVDSELKTSRDANSKFSKANVIERQEEVQDELVSGEGFTHERAMHENVPQSELESRVNVTRGILATSSPQCDNCTSISVPYTHEHNSNLQESLSNGAENDITKQLKTYEGSSSPRHHLDVEHQRNVSCISSEQISDTSTTEANVSEKAKSSTDSDKCSTMQNVSQIQNCTFIPNIMKVVNQDMTVEIKKDLVCSTGSTNLVNITEQSVLKNEQHCQTDDERRVRQAELELTQSRRKLLEQLKTLARLLDETAQEQAHLKDAEARIEALRRELQRAETRAKEKSTTITKLLGQVGHVRRVAARSRASCTTSFQKCAKFGEQVFGPSYTVPLYGKKSQSSYLQQIAQLTKKTRQNLKCTAEVPQSSHQELATSSGAASEMDSQLDTPSLNERTQPDHAPIPSHTNTSNESTHNTDTPEKSDSNASTSLAVAQNTICERDDAAVTQEKNNTSVQRSSSNLDSCKDLEGSSDHKIHVTNPGIQLKALKLGMLNIRKKLIDKPPTLCVEGQLNVIKLSEVKAGTTDRKQTFKMSDSSRLNSSSSDDSSCFPTLSRIHAVDSRYISYRDFSCDLEMKTWTENKNWSLPARSETSTTPSDDIHSHSSRLLPYVSPLIHLSYRSRPRQTSDKMDEQQTLCPYALSGICLDEECKFQHPSPNAK